jgi:hypothetical protein
MSLIMWYTLRILIGFLEASTPTFNLISIFGWSGSRVGPIYRLADIFDRYRYRYRYIGIGKLDIGIGHIGIGICIGYSGYRLYQYRSNFS